MTSVTRAEAISQGPAVGLDKGAAPRTSQRFTATLERLAWLALTAAVWAICAWLGGLLLQALAVAVSR
jgi:hypothetical protein